MINPRVGLGGREDTEGQRQLIMEVKENPLLKRMSEIIKSTGMTLGDSGMTVATQNEQDAIEGQLSGEQTDRQTLLEYQEKQALALESMSSMLKRAEDRRKQDPIALEHARNAD